MNKIKVFTFFLVVFAIITSTGFTIKGETRYKTGILYEVAGPVKQIKVEKGNEYTKWFGSDKFRPDGALESDFYTYNERGYPQQVNLSLGNKELSIKISYDDINQPIIYDFTNSMGGKIHIIRKSKYQDGKVIEYYYEDGDKVTVCEYSQHEYDSYGNWIKRMVHETQTFAEKNKSKENTYIESRKITYY
ncbi:MAG: hypothetical protein NC201_02385 [Prevotella sp.]|nr:hypothetical protein [Bacteroides sp.]MCM1366074.1 hypothetical protein [Prevotella sp.]MCM1436559.1 hypothetical protein [Prevotella sp.]